MGGRTRRIMLQNGPTTLTDLQRQTDTCHTCVTTLPQCLSSCRSGLTERLARLGGGGGGNSRELGVFLPVIDFLASPPFPPVLALPLTLPRPSSPTHASWGNGSAYVSEDAVLVQVRGCPCGRAGGERSCAGPDLPPAHTLPLQTPQPTSVGNSSVANKGTHATGISQPGRGAIELMKVWQIVSHKRDFTPFVDLEMLKT